MDRRLHALFGLLAGGLVALLLVALPRPTPPAPPAPAPAAPSVLPPPAGVPTAPAPSAAPCVEDLTGGSGSRLRVATINIHGGIGGGYRPRVLAAEITAWQADVVLVQEIHRFRLKSGLDDQPALFADLLGMQVVFGRNFSRPPEAPGRPRRESGTAIFSRLPIHSWSNQPLPNFPGLQPRGLLRATVLLEGEPIDIYGTHLQHTRGVIRIVQARGIKRLIGVAPRPFLLGGDFNAEPGSPAMNVVAGFTTDPWPQVGRGSGLTVPPRAPRRRIDYVLYGSGGWVPELAQVGGSSVADHRAVVVDYFLPRPAC